MAEEEEAQPDAREPDSATAEPTPAALPFTVVLDLAQEEVRRSQRFTGRGQLAMIWVMLGVSAGLVITGLCGVATPAFLVVGIASSLNSLFALGRHVDRADRFVERMTGELSVTVAEDGLAVATEDLRLSVRWTEVTRVRTNDEFWAVASGPGQSLPLPWRGFDAAQRLALARILAECRANAAWGTDY